MFADDILNYIEIMEQVKIKPGEVDICTEKKRNESLSKKEYMGMNERETNGTANLQAEEVKKAHKFKYLGSTVWSNGVC